MLGVKQTIILISFISVSFLTFIATWFTETPGSGITNKTPESNQQDYLSFFAKIDYYVKDGNRPSMHLKAIKLTLNSQTKINDFVAPKGESYTKEGKPVFYSAKTGRLDQNAGLVYLFDDTEIFSDQSEVQSKDAIYKMAEEVFVATANVRSESKSLKNGDVLKIDSDKVTAWPYKKNSHYEGNVVGEIIRARKYEPPVYFWSDTLFADLNKSYVKLVGSVILKKQALRATSRWGEIFLENYNKKLKYYALYDDVVVTEKVTPERGNSFQRQAYGEKLEGISSEDKIILTGHPKVIQQDEVITGNIITLFEGNEVVEVDDAQSTLKIK